MTAVHSHAERFNQGPVAQGDVGWELETAFCRHAVVCSESSVVWRCRGKPHSPTEVVAAIATVIAGVAGDSRLESDSISDGEALDTAPAFYHDSC